MTEYVRVVAEINGLPWVKAKEFSLVHLVWKVEGTKVIFYCGEQTNNLVSLPRAAVTLGANMCLTCAQHKPTVDRIDRKPPNT